MGSIVVVTCPHFAYQRIASTHPSKQKRTTYVSNTQKSRPARGVSLQELDTKSKQLLSSRPSLEEEKHTPPATSAPPAPATRNRLVGDSYLQVLPADLYPCHVHRPLQPLAALELHVRKTLHQGKRRALLSMLEHGIALRSGCKFVGVFLAQTGCWGYRPSRKPSCPTP